MPQADEDRFGFGRRGILRPLRRLRRAVDAVATVAAVTCVAVARSADARGADARGATVARVATVAAVAAASVAGAILFAAAGPPQDAAGVRPQPGNVVTGHVVPSDNERPLTGMDVVIVTAADAIVAGPRLTDTSGNFLFAHVPLGDYALRAQWSGRPYYQRWFSVSTGAPIVVEVAGRGACAPLAPGEARVSDEEIADAVRVAVATELAAPDGDRDRGRGGAVRTSTRSTARDATRTDRGNARARASKLPPIPTVPARDLPQAWLARLRGVPVSLMPEEVLQRLADRRKLERGIYYWTLSATPGSGGCVTVEIGSYLRFHANSPMIGLCCTGWHYTLRRVRDRWEFDVVMAWVS